MTRAPGFRVIAPDELTLRAVLANDFWRDSAHQAIDRKASSVQFESHHD
jgi:hypothetical protein